MYTTPADATCVVAEQRGGVASALLEGISRIGDEALTVRARELAGEISAAEANLAAVLAEIERRGIHSQWECRNIERFAGWHLQQSPARARGLADVGRAMAELPVMAEAVADGTLSFDKAKSIARVAAPETETALVELALHATTAHTQRICGNWRKIEARDNPDPDTDAPVEEHPTMLVITDDDGVELRIRFDHVHGQLVVASIDAEAKAIRTERANAAAADPANVNDPTGVPACDEDRPVEKLTQAEWRALGLLRLAERSAAEQPEGLQRSGFDTTVVVHVGIDTLYGPDITVDEPTSDRSRLHQQRDEMAELEPAGVRVRRDIARWLACDAGLLTVIEDADGNPLHLGKRTNPIPPSIRKAVMSRYRTCAWPDCVATAVQLHHTQQRSDGGHDDIENLVPECLEHHQTIHTQSISITIGSDGTIHHRRPDGTKILANPTADHPTTANALDAPDKLTDRRLALGANPTETSRQPRWHGDPLHLADCIQAILTRRRQALARTTPPRNGPTDPIPRSANHPRARTEREPVRPVNQPREDGCGGPKRATVTDRPGRDRTTRAGHRAGWYAGRPTAP
jgi:hypothetical protein